MTDSPERRRSAILFAVAVLLLVGYTCWYFNNVEDDAFITMRYALNFLRGYGWVMNSGERVEGYTSPLHLWLLTLALRWLSPDAVIFASKALGIVAGVHVLAQTRRIARLVYPDIPWLPDVTMLLLAARPEFALSMTNAMETGLAVWMLTNGVAGFLAAEAARDDRGGTVLSPAVSLWFVGAALTRPELVPMLPALLLLRWTAITPRSRGAALALFTVPLAAFLAFRVVYYHDLLPNTYYAKHMESLEAFGFGLFSFLQFGLPSTIVVECVPLTIFGMMGLQRCGRHRAVVLTIVALNVAFMLASGGTYTIDGRFVAPVMPLLALVWAGPLALIGARVRPGLPSQLAEPAARRQMAGYLVFLAIAEFLPHALLLAGTPFMRTLPETVPESQLPLGRWKAAAPEGRRRVSDWIDAHVRPGETVAQSEQGLVTLLHPDIRFLDLRGLTDRTVARMADRHHTQVGVENAGGWSDPNGEMWKYLAVQRPDWIICFDKITPEDMAPVVNGLYVPSGAFDLHGDHYDIWHVQTWRRIDHPAKPIRPYTPPVDP